MKSDFKNSLDRLELLKKLDPANCLAAIKNLPLQLKTGWYQAHKLPLNFEKNGVSSLYFCGMGGSAYPGRIIKSLYRDKMRITLEIVDSYDLPASINKQSLVVCVSYSGNTEETLTAAKEAIGRKLNILGITSGGKLGDLLKSNDKSVYIFKDEFNPSRQPRLGQGYLISASLALLSRLNFISLTDKDVEKLVQYLTGRNELLNEKVETAKNPAKKLAMAFSDKAVNLVASEFLEGTIHAVRNPLNETSKHFAQYSILPELNHHLLDGLRFPPDLRRFLLFAFVSSQLYSEKIRNRLMITRDVVSQNGLETLSIDLTAKSRFEQVFELIQLMAYVSFYLAINHNINPVPVPWVDYLKKNLKKEDPHE